MSVSETPLSTLASSTQDEDFNHTHCYGFQQSRQGGYVSGLFRAWGYDAITSGILGNFFTLLPVACITLVISACAWERNGRTLFGTSRFIARGLQINRHSESNNSNSKESPSGGANAKESGKGSLKEGKASVGDIGEDQETSTKKSNGGSRSRFGRKRKRQIFDHALWFRYWLRLNKDFLIEACGVDGMEYLIFQRHLVGLLFLLTIIGLSIILPINNMGGHLEDPSSFSASSMGNIDPESHSLWYHVTTSFFFYPICLWTMKDFARKLRYLEDRSLITSRTLILSGLPHEVRSKMDVVSHLKSEYPGVSIKRVSFCLPVSAITALLRERAFYEVIVKTLKKHGQTSTLTWNSVLLGLLCPGWTMKKDQLRYYQDWIKTSDLQIYLCLKAIKASLPLDSAFVTLRDVDQARCLMLFHKYRRNYKRNYIMEFAPPAGSVIWENVSPQYWVSLKEWMVDISLIAFVLVFAVPEFLAEFLITKLSHFYDDPSIRSVTYLVTGLLTQSLVFMSSSLLGYWTEGSINEKIFVKSYSILVIKFFLFPILSMTSFSVFLSKDSKELFDIHAVQWHCIFLPDNGALFLNNIVTMALLGNTCALLRLDLLVMHLYALAVSRSWSELLVRIRRISKTKFWIGANMVWLMINFTVTISLSISCPLILPVGLLYLISRHYIDSYNMINGYYKLPKVETKSTYRIAITVVLFSACSLQMSTTAFMLIRTTYEETHANFAAVVSAFLTLSSITFSFFQISSCHTWPIKIFKQESLVEAVSHQRILEKEKPYFPPLLLSFLKLKRREI